MVKMSSSVKQRRGGRRRKGKISNDSPPPSSSASFIGSNFDILTLILILLPSKFLLVLKSVSKRWLSIITDPIFVHQYHVKNPHLSIPAGLFWGCDLRSKERPTYEYIFLDGNTTSYVPFKTLAFKVGRSLRVGIKLMQSCNGLLLCSNRRRHNADQIYYIFNPFTKQYKMLPPSQMRSHGFPHLANISLAFDPFKSPYYKVISFWWRHSGPNYVNHRIEIYDSETSSWRLSEFDAYTPRSDCELWGPGDIFWNGSLYLCSRNGCIAYFDIGRELFGVVPLPSSAQANSDTKTFNIAEFGGRFYLIVRDWARVPLDWTNDPLGRVLSIFEMDSSDSSWNFKGQVDARLNPYVRSPGGSTNLPYLDYVIFIAKKEEEKVVLLTKESKVVSYDLKDRSFENIYDLSARQKFDGSVTFYQYFESLACV